MPVAYLWGKAFNIPLSTSQSPSSVQVFLSCHATLLYHHQSTWRASSAVLKRPGSNPIAHQRSRSFPATIASSTMHPS